MAQRNSRVSVPLIECTTTALRKSKDIGEPYTLSDKGCRLVEAALLAMLASNEPRRLQRDKIQHVLALAHLLETDLGSPAAGSRLRNVIFAFPVVGEILGVETRALRRKNQQSARFLGAEVTRRAPMLGGPSPATAIEEGSTKLSSMLLTRTPRHYR